MLFRSGENFNPEVGFLERPDGYRQTSIVLRRRIRTPALRKLGLREVEPHASYESYWGFDGFQETATLHIDNRLDFENGAFREEFGRSRSEPNGGGDGATTRSVEIKHVTGQAHAETGRQDGGHARGLLFVSA